MFKEAEAPIWESCRHLVYGLHFNKSKSVGLSCGCNLCSTILFREPKLHPWNIDALLYFLPSSPNLLYECQRLLVEFSLSLLNFLL
jgi:hypothetical protein